MCLLSVYTSQGMLQVGARVQEDMAWLSLNFSKWMGKQCPRGIFCLKKGGLPGVQPFFKT